MQEQTTRLRWRAAPLCPSLTRLSTQLPPASSPSVLRAVADVQPSNVLVRHELREVETGKRERAEEVRQPTASDSTRSAGRESCGEGKTAGLLARSLAHVVSSQGNVSQTPLRLHGLLQPVGATVTCPSSVSENRRTKKTRGAAGPRRLASRLILPMLDLSPRTRIQEAKSSRPSSAI